METQPNQQIPQTGPQIRHCRMTSSDTAPKLHGPADSTVSTPSRYEKTLSSYDQYRMERQQKPFAHLQSRVPATDASRSSGHFTNFTEINYEKYATATTSLKYRAQPHVPLCSPVRFAPNGRKWAQMTRISSFFAPESEALSQL